MKKILTLLVIGGFFIVSCGPSAEEKAAAEKAKQDSIAAVQKHMEDSVAAVQAAEKAKQDSLDAAMAKMKADSMEQAQAAAKKKPAKTPQQKKVEEVKKATRGRG